MVVQREGGISLPAFKNLTHYSNTLCKKLSILRRAFEFKEKLARSISEVLDPILRLT